MDLGLWGSVILYGIVPTVIYITIGLYILSLEHIKKRPGYKLPALIYFISVPSLIVIAVTLHFGMTYMTGAFENKHGPKPAGYALYKFLVLKDIIPRSGQSLDEEETTQTAKVTQTETTQTVEKVKFNEVDLKNKKKLNFKEHGPFYGIKKNGRMIKGILKGPKGENAQTDYYGLFTKNNMYWKGYSKHTYNDGRIMYQYNHYKLDEEGKVIIDKDGIYQLVDTYLISEDDFAKVKKYIAYDIPIPFSFYDFDTGETTQTTEVNETETSQTVEKTEEKEPSQTQEVNYKTDEKYYALVIGNNNYEHLEKLDAAQKDAEVIAEVLQDKYGFEVELLLNGDYRTTVNSIFNMTDKLKENDNLLIYYAGHGELEKAENRGYWLPVDASKKSRAEWISNQRIVDRIKATKAKHVLLMVDSCFSGTLMRSGTTTEVKETMDEKYIERLKKKKTRLVITSGGNEPVVDSDGGQHSLFALKLIDILKNNNGVINSSRLFEPIRQYVTDNADQTPERAMVHKTGHDGGDFLFFAKN